MPLPVILIFERHQDPAPKQALIDSLAILREKGYTKIAVEVDPARANYTDMLEGVQSQLKTTRQLLDQSLQVLSNLPRNTKLAISSRWGIEFPITEESLKTMDYGFLHDLLLNFVSSSRYDVLTRMFKNYDGLLKTKELLLQARAKGFQIVGIDSKVCDLKIHGDLERSKESLAEIDDVNNARDLEMSARLVLASQETGVIGLIGAMHYEGIKFYGDKLNLDAFYLSVYSQRNFVTPDTMDEVNITLGHITTNLLYNQLFPLFISKLITFKIEHKFSDEKVDCTAVRFLQSLTKSPSQVSAKVDPEHYLDVKVESDDVNLITSLKRSGIYFYQSLQRGQPTIYIPAVNDAPQLRCIQRLMPH